MEALRDVLSKRAVERVAYIHSDHFEPWRDGVTSAHVDEVAQFAEITQSLPYASKMSLFYRAHVPYGVNNDFSNPNGHRCHETDPFFFRDRTDEEDRLAKNAMRALLDGTEFDVQVHVHHEGFTRSEKLYPIIREALVGTTPERDARRFELALQLALRAIRYETGLDLRQWGFVHGNWALAASDPEICSITNELEILNRNGCFGDFTFPAGRRSCNPRRHSVPFTCLPVDEVRAYDHELAAAIEVGPGARAFSNDRMLIWNSGLPHPYCSLDSYSASSERVFEDTTGTALRWVGDSPVLNGTLYIKTHAHSMYKAYWGPGGSRVPPLAADPARRIFDAIMNAAEDCRIPFMPTTVIEANGELQKMDKPNMGIFGRLAAIFKSTNDQDESIVVEPADFVGVRVSTPMRSDSKPVPRIKKDSDQLMSGRSALDQLNLVMNAFMAARLDEMGEKESGAYGYYAERVRKEQMLPDREIELAQRIHDDHPDVTVHEAGAGAATLALAIRLLGHTTVAVEHDRRRASAAAEMVAAVESDQSLRRDWSEMRVLQDTFPSPATDHLRANSSSSMVVSTNFIGTMTDEQEAAIIEAIGRYDFAVIDLHRLRRKRPLAEERAELRDAILAAGFANAKELYAGSDFEYVLFSNSDGEPRPAAVG